MALLRSLLIAMLLGGCAGQAINQAPLYRPITGVMEIGVPIPEGEEIVRVQFQINDQVLHEDSEGADGFSATLDTAKIASGSLVKLAAIGVRPDNSTVPLQENFILIEHPIGGPAPAASDTTEPTASGSSEAGYRAGSRR